MEDSKIEELLMVSLPYKLGCGNEIYTSRSGYEKVLCDELGWKCEKSTYWDADYKGIKIEIKKGNTWLNVRRYAQLVINDIDYSNDITAIFTKYHKNQTIQAVYFVKTSDIIEKALKMNKEIAKKIIELDRHWKEICKEYIGNDTDSQVNFKVSAYKNLSFFHKIFVYDKAS